MTWIAKFLVDDEVAGNAEPWSISLYRLLLYWVKFLSPNFVSVRTFRQPLKQAAAMSVTARSLDSSNSSMAVVE